MIIHQDPETGYWNRTNAHGVTFHTHSPEECVGRLCDIHNRRGEGPDANWPLNWREDRGIMEVICPCGIGHPTPAQEQYVYWLSMTDQLDLANAHAELVHGCCVVHCPQIMHLASQYVTIPKEETE